MNKGLTSIFFLVLMFNFLDIYVFEKLIFLLNTLLYCDNLYFYSDFLLYRHFLCIKMIFLVNSYKEILLRFITTQIKSFLSSFWIFKISSLRSFNSLRSKVPYCDYKFLEFVKTCLLPLVTADVC